mgnify:CR=1 FL=1
MGLSLRLNLMKNEHIGFLNLDILILREQDTHFWDSLHLSLHATVRRRQLLYV